MKEYIKYYFKVFPIAYMGVSLAYAICGMIAGNDQFLRYAHVLYPMGLAAVCTIPAPLTCKSDELSGKQLLYRRLLQLILIEGIVLSAVYYFAPEGSSVPTKDLVMIGFSVIIVYILVRIVLWSTAYLDAQELNRKLKVLKEIDNHK